MKTIDISVPRRAPRPRQKAQTLRAAVSLIRPGDTALVVLGTVVGARIAHLGAVPLIAIAAIAVANGLLCAASMAFNDWHDVIEDAINRPDRPIVAGRISRPTVLLIALTLFATGLLLTWLSVPRLGLAAIALVGTSIAYTTRLKAVPILGNALVAIVHSYPMWCWLAVGASAGVTYAALCLAIIGYRFGAELVKTAEDWRGDLVSGVSTVATRWGASLALVVGCAVAALATAIAWYPAAAGSVRLIYLAWLVPVTALTALACVESRRTRYPPEIAARRINRLERISLAVAVVGLAIGLV